MLQKQAPNFLLISAAMSLHWYGFVRARNSSRPGLLRQPHVMHWHHLAAVLQLFTVLLLILCMP